MEFVMVRWSVVGGEWSCKVGAMAPAAWAWSYGTKDGPKRMVPRSLCAWSWRSKYGRGVTALGADLEDARRRMREERIRAGLDAPQVWAAA
jgi:hypothetical protein